MSPFILRNHIVAYLNAGVHKYVFCEKSKRLFCVQKEALEEYLNNRLQVDLQTMKNKTLENVYNTATDCIQYCKVNNEKVGCLGILGVVEEESFNFLL